MGLDYYDDYMRELYDEDDTKNKQLIVYKDRMDINEVTTIKYGMNVFPYFSMEVVRLGEIRAIFFGLFHENINLSVDIHMNWFDGVLEKLRYCFGWVKKVKKINCIMDDMEVYYHPDINPVKFDGLVKIWGQKTVLGKSSGLKFKETVDKVKERLDMCLDEKVVI